MLPGPKDLTEPHQELRFTRGAQASLFALVGAVCCGAAAAVVILNLIPKDSVTPWWWPLVPLPFAALFFRLAFRCARHAYIILTPLGIEIFPFFNSRENLQVLYWSQIADSELNDRNELVIHFNEEQTSGVVASLAPITPSRRILLERAIKGRMQYDWVEVPSSGD